MQTESKEIELLPCPFCGGKAKITQYKMNGWRIKCTNCLIEKVQKAFHYPVDWLKDKMIEDWNKRPSPPVEQTVDAGQLEKIIDDAFQAGQKREYHEFKRAYNDVYKWEEAEEHIPTKSQYIEQAIEQFNNSKK